MTVGSYDVAHPLEISNIKHLSHFRLRTILNIEQLRIESLYSKLDCNNQFINLS